jgi:hypothetical protein
VWARGVRDTDGRIAPLQELSAEGPESALNPSFDSERALGFTVRNGLRQTLQQPLRFGNLRHFRSRGKVFERWREDPPNTRL